LLDLLPYQVSSASSSRTVGELVLRTLLIFIIIIIISWWSSECNSPLQRASHFMCPFT